MTILKSLKIVTAAAVVALAASNASAVDIACGTNPSINHMLVDDSQVSACLASGVGNISGNPSGGNADPFLTGVGSEYELASKTGEGEDNPFNLAYTQDGDTGTWSFDASAWDAYTDLAIGFKFGTGNQPDEWFVYSVATLVASGDWEFVNVFGTGGGLSHMNLYGIAGEFPPGQVPEPAGLALLGIGALGLALAGKRRRKN